MGIIRKFIGNKLVEAAIKAGHVPAETPENEEDRLKDLERLKLIEENINDEKLNEFEADNYAKETYSGDSLSLALKKLSVDNLSNLYPHPFYTFLHYSHPPLLHRLEALSE